MCLLVLVVLLFFGLGVVFGACVGVLLLLSHQLAALKDASGANEERMVGPAMTPIKQALRAWVERQLPHRPPNDAEGNGHLLTADDLAPLAARMNAALDAAGLTCGDDRKPSYRCSVPDNSAEDFRGHVEGVRLALFDGDRYLLVVTGVGVSCGFDESAYIFEHRADRAWHLLLASEQNDYRNGHYHAQHLIAVNVSPSEVAWNEPAPPPLVSTLGYSPWCSSNWHSLYTRLWRASAATATPAPLVDRDDSLFMGDYFIAAARLTARDLVVQFTGGSIDGGVLVRPHVLHYRVAPGGKLGRIAPMAL